MWLNNAIGLTGTYWKAIIHKENDDTNEVLIGYQSVSYHE